MVWSEVLPWHFHEVTKTNHKSPQFMTVALGL